MFHFNLNYSKEEISEAIEEALEFSRLLPDSRFEIQTKPNHKVYDLDGLIPGEVIRSIFSSSSIQLQLCA